MSYFTRPYLAPVIVVFSSKEGKIVKIASFAERESCFFEPDHDTTDLSLVADGFVSTGE